MSLYYIDMPKTKALKPIPEQKDKKKSKKENKIDYNIYGVRKQVICKIL